MAVMHIDFEGKEYSFDLEDITLTQASTIFGKYGFTLMNLEDALSDGNPGALRAIYWLMMCQNESSPPDIDRLDFKVVKFARAVDAAARANLEPGEEDVPKDTATQA